MQQDKKYIYSDYLKIYIKKVQLGSREYLFICIWGFGKEKEAVGH